MCRGLCFESPSQLFDKSGFIDEAIGPSFRLPSARGDTFEPPEDSVLTATIAPFRGATDMAADRDYQQIFRKAGERWLEGDVSAIDDFERGIEIALEDGDIAAALSAHQKLLVWKPGEVDLHRRVARAIAAARDRAEQRPDEMGRLAKIPLFSGVPREELATLLTLVAPIKTSAGSAVVREGEAGDSLFLIVSGRLRVSTRSADGAEVPLAELGPGEFFGEVALLTRRPRTATVTAITEAELLRLDHYTVDELRLRHPDIDASLSEFHRRRAERTIESLIERMKKAGH